MSQAVFIDIDDTITYENEYLIRNAPKYLTKKGFNSTIVNKSGYSLDEIYGITEQLEKKGFSHDEARENAKKLSADFWNKNFWVYNHTPIRDGCGEFVSEIRKYGFHVYILTLRGYNSKSDAKGVKYLFFSWIVSLITQKMFAKNRIRYDDIIYVKTMDEKAEYIKNCSTKLVIDDQVYLHNAIQRENDSIVGICMSSPHNIDKELPPNTIRINNYMEGIQILHKMMSGEMI